VLSYDALSDGVTPDFLLERVLAKVQPADLDGAPAEELSAVEELAA
jgi:hypothetical protein